MNGHSDVIGGAVVTSDQDLFERLRFLQNAVGGVPSPLDLSDFLDSLVVLKIPKGEAWKVGPLTAVLSLYCAATAPKAS